MVYRLWLLLPTEWGQEVRAHKDFGKLPAYGELHHRISKLRTWGICWWYKTSTYVQLGVQLALQKWPISSQEFLGSRQEDTLLDFNVCLGNTFPPILMWALGLTMLTDRDMEPEKSNTSLGLCVLGKYRHTVCVSLPTLQTDFFRNQELLRAHVAVNIFVRPRLLTQMGRPLWLCSETHLGL